jgi:hypothetical protein
MPTIANGGHIDTSNRLSKNQYLSILYLNSYQHLTKAIDRWIGSELTIMRKQQFDNIYLKKYCTSIDFENQTVKLEENT